MDISNISHHDSCNKNVIETLDKYKKKWCMKGKEVLPSTSLFYCDSIENVEVFPVSYNLYILAKNPIKSFAAMTQLKPCDGEHILTVVGESRCLYSSKTTELITEFLHSEAYLTKRQSQKYFTVFQESALNAIEHGNLGLSSHKKEKNSPEQWFEKYKAISSDELFNNPAGEKLVTIQCYLNEGRIATKVLDEGVGFDFEATCSSKAEDYQTHGRGIVLIEGLSDHYKYSDGGRCIEFSFNANFLEQYTHMPNGFDRSNAKILIVDDQESNLLIAKHYLESAGYENIQLALSGEEAVKIAKITIPDVIILDVVMPEMDGFTACRKIKQIPECRNIPVLFFTSLKDSESCVRGYRLGAVDYVMKPIQRGELVARADTHIQHSVLIKSINRNLERIQDDVNRARLVQLELLPNEKEIKLLETRNNMRIGTCFNTCDELAGDYWTLHDLGGGQISIILADFTGHGVAASFNTVRLHALIQESAKFLGDPKDFICHINEKLKQSIPIEDFATFVYGILDSETGEFCYIGCGSPPIAVIPKDPNDNCYYLKCEGLPLGLAQNDSLNLRIKHTKLSPGDTLLLFSDALLETRHQETDDMWGEKTLLQKLTQIRIDHESIDLRDVLREFNKTAQKPLKDDLTMLCLTYRVNDNVNEVLPHSYSHLDALQQELLD